MQPSLPEEILAHIADSLFAEEISQNSERHSPTSLTLLVTSKALRICALRNLCRTVVVDCDDDKPNDKLRDILISAPINPCLGTITPFIQTLQINLRNCTSSPAALDEVTTLLEFILKQCPLQKLILEGTYCDEDYPESYSEYSLNWTDLPSPLCGVIGALLRASMLTSLELYSMSGLCTNLFEEAPHMESVLINFSQVPPSPALERLRRIVAYDLGTPKQIDGVWDICRYAHQYLEELEIDDGFWDIDAIGLRENPYTLPDSLHLHSFPKLKKFIYSHNYVGWLDYPLSPPTSFFRGGVVPELQSLHLCVRLDKVIDEAAWSFEEAILKLADSNWAILDSLLTSTDFPNLQRVHLVLEQDVNISSHQFVMNADGVRCPLATTRALQCQIEDSLKSSFSGLKASTVIDFKLDAIVNLNKGTRC